MGKKVKEQINEIFGNEELGHDFKDFLKETRGYNEHVWGTKSEWIDYLRRTFNFNLDNKEESNKIKKNITRFYAFTSISEEFVYKINEQHDIYEKIEQDEIEKYVKNFKGKSKNDHENVLKEFEKSNEQSLSQFLYHMHAHIFLNMLIHNEGIFKEFEKDYFYDINEEYGHFLESDLIDIVLDLTSNEEISDDYGFKIDNNWEKLIKVEEKEIKKNLVVMIFESPKGKQKINKLKYNEKEKFKNLNKYLENELDVFLEQGNIR